MTLYAVKSPLFFASPSDFRKWLEENSQTETELLVGFYKVATKKPTLSWSESVDEALCFGWIDGIRRTIDHESYCIRFTPRNPKSNWSAVNIKKVEELIQSGKMTPAGLAAFEKRREDRSAIYSYENRPEKFDPKMEILFRKNPDSWTFFSSQPLSYQKTIIYWVMSAKQESTRLVRLSKLISASESGNKLY
ncbi:MAG TPA: bacteriocin-protection protein [Prolixibacteraceae bacterium]|nr:bacteriocin-protection protein [Prolixibacteraceae bacterium]